MSWHSLAHLVNFLENQANWQQYQEYQALNTAWQLVIDPKIAPFTRPLYLQRQVLWVATASAVWAQQLSLQRQDLLQKLHQHFHEPLEDLRFSTAHWHNFNTVNTGSSLETHPSYLPLETPVGEDLPAATTPQAAFERWANLIKQRSQLLSPCPSCHCPTPSGELERWSVCYHCAARAKS